MLWRFDKDWKAVWREVPWLKAKPSEYVQRHFRATTAPAQMPADRDQAAKLAEMLGAGEFLLFASDHPHRHGDGNLETLLEVLDDGGREAVMHGNAAALYGLTA
jgi:predicted TIM-barrel fold metal-dependent hydrolase